MLQRSQRRHLRQGALIQGFIGHPPQGTAQGKAEGSQDLVIGDAGQQGADVIKALPQGDGIPGIKITGAKITGAKITGAKITGAKITGAKITGAKITGAKIT
ncbi:pentapeptide repeat-containing protein, partial [Prochlorothrix hollandica]|uniref:pentapeptide repeat-containing protein n=1 Tax=Prochlorothrix hollandica TaxID=1223 RepID=UPI003DA6E475